MRAAVLLTSVLYFVLAHAATLAGDDRLRIAAVGVLVVLLLLALRGRIGLQLAVLALVALTAALAPDPLPLLLYAPPVLIPLALAAFVAASLRPGRQPLIERVVWHMHGRPILLEEHFRRYARGVTIYWCGVFLFMAFLNLGLALFASPELWSWVGNLIGYVLPLLAFLAEYAWRKRVFPVQDYRNLFDYLARVIRLGPTLVAEFSGRRAPDPYADAAQPPDR